VEHDDEITVGLRLTRDQLDAIDSRLGLGPFCGTARSGYMIDLALGEPETVALERAHAVHAADVARRRRP
jgi:hypothetical protein